MTNSKKRGFTLVELLVVISIIALLIGILLPALSRARKNAVQLKDGTQVRGIVQAFTTWAGDNKGSYPRPEVADKLNDTEVDAANKDRTGNVYSLLIYAQITTPEMQVSQAETAQMVVFEDYEYDDPTGVPFPRRALWDPKFKGTPKDHQASTPPTGIDPNPVGHNSYAHNVIAGARQKNWTNTFSSTQPVVSNRGGVYEETETPAVGDTWTLLSGSDAVYGESSDAVLMHGKQGRWAGNVGFADGNVTFFNDPDPEPVTFLDKTGTNPRAQRDNLFVDEENEGSGSNNVATRTNAVMRTWFDGIPPADTFDTEHLEAPGGSYVWVDGE